MTDLPRPVWVRSGDDRLLPGWCQAVRRDAERRWIGFVSYTDHASGLRYLQWLDEAVLSPRGGARRRDVATLPAHGP